MKEINLALHTYTLRAVLESHANPSTESSGTAERSDGLIRLLYADGSLTAMSWLHLAMRASDSVRKVEATLVPMTCDDREVQLAVAIEDTPDADVFQLIPDSFSQTDGLMYRLRDVVDVIETPALRWFLSEVFSLVPVYNHFWTAPASQQHHHNYKGGLADHTIEIAENVADTPRLSVVERDIGIAYAVCHDIGKIWAYNPLCKSAASIGHELAGLAQLHQPLERLASDWPEAAAALRGLMAGLWKYRGGRPLLSVGKLVQAYDQASVEHERIRRGSTEPRFDVLRTGTK